MNVRHRKLSFSVQNLCEFSYSLKGIKNPFKYKATAHYGVSVVQIVKITGLHRIDVITLITGLMYSKAMCFMLLMYYRSMCTLNENSVLRRVSCVLN